MRTDLLEGPFYAKGHIALKYKGKFIFCCRNRTDYETFLVFLEKGFSIEEARQHILSIQSSQHRAPASRKENEEKYKKMLKEMRIHATNTRT